MDTQPISTNCCPKCHTPLPSDAPQGLCPKCLFAAVATPTEAGQPAGHRATPPPLEEIAAAFPQLEILEFIGQGGMGFVFKARQPKLDRLVALKILPQSLAADPTFAERFNREARLLARLSHPGIVTVHDFGVATHQPSTINHQPFYYLLMEFVDGVNLRQAMQAGRFTPEQALAIVPKICEALQFAHNEGILHRDIKPENILLDAKGRVKLADFGIAKLVGNDTERSAEHCSAGSPEHHQAEQCSALQLTEAGKSLGTPNYMAPEQLANAGEVDHRADIYSLGVVFYEMLTGELPLGRFAPPSQKSAADPRVDEVVLRALEKEKSRRYASAEEVKTQVETLVARSSRRKESPSESGGGETRTGFEGHDAFFPPRTQWTNAIHASIRIILCIGVGLFIYKFRGSREWDFVNTCLTLVGAAILLDLLIRMVRKRKSVSAAQSRSSEKPHQDFMTWSVFQSPEVQEICAHFTKAERNHVSVLSLLISILICGTCFGLPAFIRADFGDGKWIVAALWIILFVVSLRQFQQMMRHFLCSTAWAKEHGFVPEKLRLFLFNPGRILTACALFAVLLALGVAQYQAMTRWLPFWPQTGTAPKMPPAPKQKVPNQPPLTFGPVIERVVEELGPPNFNRFDLETGKSVRGPSELFQGDSDVHAESRDGHRGLSPRGNNCPLIPVSAAHWDTTPASAVASLLPPYTNVRLALQKLFSEGDLPATFAFKTGAGGMGLLQITGFTEDPRGVKLRYKLVQTETNQNPDARR